MTNIDFLKDLMVINTTHRVYDIEENQGWDKENFIPPTKKTKDDKYIGTKINHLLILGVYRKMNGSNNFFECLCDCGSTKMIKTYSIHKSFSSSCGCLQGRK
jgi:hypothetical protein